ncbi:hypothetical protein RN333_08665 [Enterobacter kobei]|uniref:hypothetical protein n=1 Tax=Enterobacter kobei TaxID=208224 RepID=UPI0028D79750|nr:hypothetical protein [Enterobacter kobei]WNP36252.1 hypothetical protein RN333_08665 [Enterobacter kobei]
MQTVRDAIIAISKKNTEVKKYVKQFHNSEISEEQLICSVIEHLGSEVLRLEEAETNFWQSVW